MLEILAIVVDILYMYIYIYISCISLKRMILIVFGLCQCLCLCAWMSIKVTRTLSQFSAVDLHVQPSTRSGLWRVHMLPVYAFTSSGPMPDILVNLLTAPQRGLFYLLIYLFIFRWKPVLRRNHSAHNHLISSRDGRRRLIHLNCFFSLISFISVPFNCGYLKKINREYQTAGSR